MPLSFSGEVLELPAAAVAAEMSAMRAADVVVCTTETVRAELGVQWKWNKPGDATIYTAIV